MENPQVPPCHPRLWMGPSIPECTNSIVVLKILRYAFHHPSSAARFSNSSMAELPLSRALSIPDDGSKTAASDKNKLVVWCCKNPWMAWACVDSSCGSNVVGNGNSWSGGTAWRWLRLPLFVVVVVVVVVFVLVVAVVYDERGDATEAGWNASTSTFTWHPTINSSGSRRSAELVVLVGVRVFIVVVVVVVVELSWKSIGSINSFSMVDRLVDSSSEAVKYSSCRVSLLYLYLGSKECRSNRLDTSIRYVLVQYYCKGFVILFDV